MTFTVNLSESFITSSILTEFKSEIPVSNYVFRNRNIVGFPISNTQQYSRTRQNSTVTGTFFDYLRTRQNNSTTGKFSNYSRTRQSDGTAGAFSYLHNGFLTTQTESLTGFLAKPSYNYKYTRAIIDTIINPKPTGDVIGSELGDAISDELSNTIGSETLVFNDSVSSLAVINTPGNQRIVENLNTIDTLSSQTIYNRKKIDGTTFTLQTESGSGIYTNTASGIVISGIHTYDTVSYAKAKVRSLSDFIIKPGPTGDIIGSELGDVITDELGNTIGSEALTFNSSVSSSVIIQSVTSNLRYLSETLPILALVSSALITNRKITENLSTSDALSSQVIYNRKETDGTTFTLQTESGSGIYTNTTNGIIVSNVHAYDTLSYVKVAVRNLSDSLSTNDSLSFIIHTRKLYSISDGTIYTLQTESGSGVYTNTANSIVISGIHTIDTLSKRVFNFRFQTDTTHVNDSVISYGTKNYLVTDSLSTSDSISASRQYFRSPSDTLVTSPVLTYSIITRAAPTSISISISETLTTNDTNSYSIIRIRSLTNVTTTQISDSLTQNIAYTRQLNDSVLTSSNVSTANNHYFLSDNLTLLDTIASVRIYSRSISETTTITDSVANVKYSKYITRANEVLTISDSLTYTISRSYLANFSENLSTSSTLSSSTNRGRNLVENIPTSDTLSVYQSVSRLETENLTTADTLSESSIHIYNLRDDISGFFANSVGRIRSNTINITDTTQTIDSVARGNVTNYRAVNESLSISDSLSHSVTLYRQAQNTNYGNQLLTSGQQYATSLTSTFVTSDAVSYIQPATIYITDTLRIIDARLNRRVIYTRNIAETFTTFVTTTINLSNQKFALSDAILGSQQLTYTRNFISSLTDSNPALSTSITSLIIPVSFIQEILNTSASVLYKVRPAHQLVDYLFTNASLTTRTIPAVHLSDTFITSDKLERGNSNVIKETLPRVSDVVSYVIFSPLKANLQETLITSDSVQTQFKSYSVSLTDNLPRVSDAVYIRVHTPIIVNLIDALSTSTTLSVVFLPRNFFFQESLLLTDSVSHQVIATRSEIYTSTFSESVTSRANFSYKVNESITTSDNLNQTSFVTRTPSDTSFESEIVTHKAIVYRTVSDSLQTLDSVARNVNYSRINQDNFNTTPSVARSVIAYRTEYYIAVRNDTSIARGVTVTRNVASSFTVVDLNSRFVSTARVLRDDSSTNDSNARFITAPRNPIVNLPTVIKLTRFVTGSRSLMDSSTTFDASIYFIARQALLQDAMAVSDAIVRITFYTRRPLDVSSFIDTPKPNTIKYRQAHDLTGITEYVMWRHPFIFSNKIFESYKTHSSLNYAFKIIEILLPIELYSNVLFENDGVVGKGRVVSIRSDTYTIAPYAETIAKSENFYVVPKANVALLPPNYR